MSSFARKKIIREYYLKRSGDYDEQKRRTWKSGKGFGDEIIDALVDAVRVSENPVVLEVCMGTGRTSLPLLKRVKMHLVGLDLSKEMLETAKEKMFSCKKRFDLILGDAEHLPFKENVFDAVICTSAMHYFDDPAHYLVGLSRVIRKNCPFIYGDLTLHESDELSFLNRLERTVSHAHERYLKPSEAKAVLESQGLHLSKTETFAYRKTLEHLMEDKGTYFQVKPQTLRDILKTASKKERKLYSINSKELTLYYTIIVSVKGSSPDHFMSKRSTCIKVPKIYGEKTIVSINKMRIINKGLKIKKNDRFIYVPILQKPSETLLKTLKQQVASMRISTSLFQEKPKGPATYPELLDDKIPKRLQASLPHSADIIGDIAIIELSPELQEHRALIGGAILRTYKNVKTVLAKAGAVSGTYRLREFEIIAGEPKTVTMHKEHGCRFLVDVAKVYFSPRLSYERNRVASLVKEHETVVDLFAGVGPFAMQVAKKHENVEVYAVDVNPDAVQLMKKNSRLNRVDDRVHPILGDARQVVNDKIGGIADRVIMNLPEKAIDFVDVACKALKPVGGVLHFYCFIDASNSLKTMRRRLAEAVETSGRRIRKKPLSKLVRATAPHEWQAVLDVEIS